MVDRENVAEPAVAIAEELATALAARVWRGLKEARDAGVEEGEGEGAGDEMASQRKRKCQRE